ncbi:peptide chain release factor family protein [Calycomorphotria hydatis]|uniref:Peptide chain release factor 1 n=1 Tax=Calycomorphotria hydatis TaxID=2528027 RepID=A0A517T5T2_9PLAN|nr:peptide chain release factor-like protein [Calycomorphotria hydatis]QDT63746.1 Peptide chain release factor 1 [Calycomorphotria hydatis]
MHPAELPVDQLLKDCQITRVKRSGPGGQHRNKVETCVVIEHLPTGIRAEAAERRSLEQNRKVAIRRLRMRLAVDHRIERDDEAALNPIWATRVRNGRISVNAKHEDLPAMIAELLDLLTIYHGEIPVAARRLGCTASQIVKFLKLEPLAFQRLSTIRERAGKKALH